MPPARSTAPTAWLLALSLVAACASTAGMVVTSDSPPLPDAATPRDAGPSSADLAHAVEAVQPVLEDASCAPCSIYATPVMLGRVAIPALDEASGLAASRAHPGVLYSHNDSGAGPVIYALSVGGAGLGELLLGGATNFDWEDLALGPCPSGTCLYAGDIGDNSANRKSYTLYRVPEPNVSVNAPMGSRPVPAERFDFTYEGGGHPDAETLLVHPRTGDVYIVTKRGLLRHSAVYKLAAPLTVGAPRVAKKLADLQVPAFLDLPITSGAIHPCGNALLLRTYNTIYRFELDAGAPFDTIFTAPFTRVESPIEPQGEAISWSADGRGYYTLSEHARQPIYYMGCR